MGVINKFVAYRGLFTGAIAVEDGFNGLVADASDLGLRPGVWPASITVVNKPDDSPLHGVEFVRGHAMKNSDEVYAVRYVSLAGKTMIVYND